VSFKLPNIFPDAGMLLLEDELFETLAGNMDVKIERIISQGQVTPERYWYDQPADEWVILLSGKAKIIFENEDVIELLAGNYLLIPAHTKHKVTYTSTDPFCVWLAIHGKLT